MEQLIIPLFKSESLTKAEKRSEKEIERMIGRLDRIKELMERLEREKL